MKITHTYPKYNSEEQALIALGKKLEDAYNKILVDKNVYVATLPKTSTELSA